MLRQPNAAGTQNGDVVRPWVNGSDVTKRLRGMYVVDFGCNMTMEEAARYQAPFKLLEDRVKPDRVGNRRASYAERWWLHVEPRPAMRNALPARRYVATPNVTKHRLFSFLSHPTLPDHQLIAFARSDDYFFGVLQSSVHDLWARRMGTQLREAESGFRYTPTTCFETFPLPWPPGKEDAAHPAYQRIAAAAKELNELRERELNPPEWLEPLEQKVDAADDFADVPAAARPLLRRAAVMAMAAKDARLKGRTLTNLYNKRETWLKLAHERLDRAVLAAYTATDPVGGWDESWAGVWVETGAGVPLPADHPLAAERARVDQTVLSNLLRLNLRRAADAGSSTHPRPRRPTES